MPLTSKLLEAQALYYKNVPLINRKIKATVHLENKDDELFWNSMIQQVLPGQYNYVYSYRDSQGKETRGSGLCMYVEHRGG
jgi:hypothetical protein